MPHSCCFTCQCEVIQIKLIETIQKLLLCFLTQHTCFEDRFQYRWFTSLHFTKLLSGSELIILPYIYYGHLCNEELHVNGVRNIFMTKEFTRRQLQKFMSTIMKSALIKTKSSEYRGIWYVFCNYLPIEGLAVINKLADKGTAMT